MNRQVIRFPEKGLDADTMLAELKGHRSDDASWRNGRMFGYIYHPGNREAKAIEQAYLLFLNENALNPSLFSSLRRLENETVAMVADLLFHVDSCLGDELSKRGWNLDKLQFPSALHMTVSFDNTGHEGEFLEALKESVSAVEGQKIKTVSSHVLASVVKTLSRFLPEKWFRKLSARFTALMNRDQGGGAATGAAAYGMMVAIDNRGNVDEIMLDVLDKLYTV